MSHVVKCTVCGCSFDRDKVQAVKSGARRYAHYSCLPSGELVPLAEKTKEEDPDLKQLKDYINNLYGEKANWVLIQKQLKDYVNNYNYSYSGILKSLIWFHEIKGNSVEQSLEKGHGGLGIVPFSYQAAFNYYYSLFVAQQVNENKILNKEVKEVKILPPRMTGTKQRIIDLEELLDEEE